MDNNTDKSQDEQPVFSSTQIVNTKSRTSGPYFTNVQDATLGQKISNWFAKFRRDSEARSEARSAALKAKIAQKKRDADIAAISINLPDNANSISNPALVKSPVYAEQIAAEAQKKKPNKPLLIVLIIVIILLIIGVLLAILRPWETQATGSSSDAQPSEWSKEETPIAGSINRDDVYAAYQNGGREAIDDYYYDLLSSSNSEYDNAAILANQVIFYVFVNETDDINSLIDKVDTEKLSNENRYRYYLTLNSYYRNSGDDELAEKYFNAAMDVPDVEDMKLGGGA